MDQEAEALNALFDEGLQTLHFRKPDYDKANFEGALKAIKPKYLKRVVIHSHYELIDRYNLKGIHFPEKILADLEDASGAIKKLQSKGMTVSASFHSIDRLYKNSYPLDYVFLSPIFESISKPGYKSEMDLKELSAFIASAKKKPKVIALGGVETDKVPELIKAGFDGFAILGSLWNKYRISTNIDTLKEKYRDFVNLTKAHAGQA